MDSSTDAVQQVKEIVSPSLILKPPANELFKIIEGFDFIDHEWLGLPATSQATTDATTKATTKEINEPYCDSVALIAETLAEDPAEDGKENELYNEPENKKPRLSLSLKKTRGKAIIKSTNDPALKQNNSRVDNASPPHRFASPVSENDLIIAAGGVIPANTKASTQWAERNFISWITERNKVVPNDPVPVDLLSCHDAELVCKNLCRFVLETRNSNGQPYPPATIRSLLSGLSRILKSNKAPFSIFNKEDTRFRDLQLTLDSMSSELHKKGIGAARNSASVITEEDENTLWAKGALGTSSPQILQHTIFFYIGLHFCLRGVQEQYDLTPRQLIRFPPDTSIYHSGVYYQYTEFVSKNNQHRFKDINLSNKVVRSHASPGSNRCLVKLLDTYLSKLVPNAACVHCLKLPQIPVNLGMQNKELESTLSKR